jgi:hypothetical protein
MSFPYEHGWTEGTPRIMSERSLDSPKIEEFFFGLAITLLGALSVWKNSRIFGPLMNEKGQDTCDLDKPRDRDVRPFESRPSHCLHPKISL